MARPRNAERAAIAERRTRVLAMRVEQRPYAEIAAQLGISETLARSDYVRALEQRRTELDQQRHLAVAAELAKLDALEREAWRVLRARHITVQHGKIVGRFTGFAADPDTGETYRGDDDKPIPLYEEIEDDAPVLQAVDRLERISRRRAALLGLDAPTRIEVDDGRRAEIEALAAELAAGVGDVEQSGTGTAAGDAAAG